jgi:Fur family transcriptional regulator, peroxide stress response regulator
VKSVNCAGCAKATCITLSFDSSIHLRKMRSLEKKERMERFFEAHREGGFPVTSQRRAVFEAILERLDHPTAEQLYREVRRELPQISRMTVHRILGAFASLGLVAKTCHPGSAARFDPKVDQHHHLVCMDCGSIIDVEDPRLDRLPLPKIKPRGFQIHDFNVHFRGRCASCVKAARRSRAE